MLTKNLLFTPLLAAGLASAGIIKPIRSNFELLTVAPTTDIHFSGFQAAGNRIRLELEDQAAVCRAESDNLATFTLFAGTLWLYQKPRLLQQIYVDRSAAGQGRVGYTTSPQASRPGVDKMGWRLDGNDNLLFKKSGFIACPGTGDDDAWTLWIDVGTAQPGGGTGCVPLEARRISLSNLNSCQYTDETAEDG